MCNCDFCYKKIYKSEMMWHFVGVYNYNKNALSSVESRLFVDKIRSEEVNRARAFVTRGGGGGGGGGRSAYKRAWDARRLA